MFIAFRQANLSFTGTCNTDEKKNKKTKKQTNKKQDGTKFAHFHTAKEEYIVSPMQVKRQQAPTFAFLSQFFLSSVFIHTSVNLPPGKLWSR